MRDVTIFSNFTVLETIMFNSVQVDKGFDAMDGRKVKVFEKNSKVSISFTGETKNSRKLY